MKNFKKLVKKTGIILALDVLEKISAFKLLSKIYADIDCVKIGYPLVLNSGLEIVDEIKTKYDVPILADFKVSDIPHISRTIVRIAFDAGCDGVLVHGFIGPDAIKACIDEDKNRMIFVITELTSPGGKIFYQQISEDVAVMAKQLGAYGIQAPGTRPDRIRKLRELVKDRMVIISCGIGAQGPKPGTAIRAGSDFEIIGRAIYASSDPIKSVKNIKKALAR